MDDCRGVACDVYVLGFTDGKGVGLVGDAVGILVGGELNVGTEK